MDHLFISYSKKDIDFARHLRKLLEEEDFGVWMDESNLVPSEQWWPAIERNIDSCAAFLVIMSPQSKESRWVEREILRAESQKKPLFPILLEGEAWSRLADIQYADMTAGLPASLPPPLLQGLEAVVPRNSPNPVPPPLDQAPKQTGMDSPVSATEIKQAPKLTLLLTSIASLVVVILGIVYAGWRTEVFGLWDRNHSSDSQKTAVALAAQQSATQTAVALNSTATPTPTAATPTPSPSKTPPPTAIPDLTPSTPEPPQEMVAIMQRFAVPGGSSNMIDGITWDGESLWMSANLGDIFNVNTSGVLLGAYQAPDVTPMGLTWDGSSFWMFTTNHWLVHRFVIEGQQSRSLSNFKAPIQSTGGTNNDLAWDGTTLWLADEHNIYQTDTAGTVLQTLPFSQPVAGLDWDGRNFWVAYNDFPDGAFLSLVAPGGEILGSFLTPIYQIDGLAWGDDMLWAIGRDELGGDQWVYELDVSRTAVISAPRSQAVWEVIVSEAYHSSTLVPYPATDMGAPVPLRQAAAGMTFLVLVLGLKTSSQNAVLEPQEVQLVDDQGQSYRAVGMEVQHFGGYLVGEMSGDLVMKYLDPPQIVFEYSIVTQPSASRTETNEGSFPVMAYSGNWPLVVWIWQVPSAAAGFRVLVPGDETEVGEPQPLDERGS